MKFSDPNMLYLIWVILLLFCVIFYGNRKRKRIIRSFAAAKERSSIIPEFSAARRWVKGLLLIVSLFFIAFSLAGPLVGFTWEKVEQKGVDIMICLDCSRSMLASDIKPSRLERAKREILDLLKMMKSDRAGLVAFAGDALLQCPLTLDHQAFNIFLKALNPDFLPVGGTDISGAIETALNSFEEKIDSEKAIILITDGENTSGEPLKIAKKAVDQGIKIFCIGVGNREGAPVPDKEGGFTKDDSGRIILSKVDDSGLKEIAAMADGIYVRSVAGDMDLDKIYIENIQQHMEKKTLKSGRKKVWENRFQWFLFPALLLLLIELCIAKEKKINNLSDTAIGISSKPNEKKYTLKKNNHLSGMIAAFILVTLSFSSICHATASSSVKKGIKSYVDNDYEKAEKYFIDAQLQRPDMLELYYNIGTAAYKKGDYEAALKNFIKASETEDKELKQKVIYNLGNTKFRLGKLEEAVKDYEKVLLQNIGDLKAKENLEFVKKKIEEKKKQQKNKDNQNKDNQNKDNQNKDNQNKDNQNKDNQNKDNQNKDNQNKDNQNKDNQNKDNQNKDNQDKKSKSSDRDNKKNDPRNKNGDDKDSNKGNKPSDKKEEQKGEQRANSGQDDQNLQKSSQEQNRAGERVLNRLEDKPGKAMIPAYGNQNVKKDW